MGAPLGHERSGRRIASLVAPLGKRPWSEARVRKTRPARALTIRRQAGTSLVVVVAVRGVLGVIDDTDGDALGVAAPDADLELEA
jgi:hypothetical protein